MTGPGGFFHLPTPVDLPRKWNSISGTISNSYKDDKGGDWKTTTSFSPTDLLVVCELAGQAFAKIAELKTQGRGL